MSGWTVPGYVEAGDLRSGPGGRVVRAVRETTGDAVAVRYLPALWRSDAGFTADFPREVRRLAAVDAPEVVRLHAFVRGPLQDAVVMDLVHGVALRDLLRQAGRTGPEAALAVLKSTLLALSAVHRAGLVHRACRPGKVLVTADGAVRLSGCGMAPRSSGPGTLSAAGYLAPEQWGGGVASPASDAYAATVVFFECLTGSPPYVGESVADLSVQHITAPVPEHRVPEPVRALVRRGLAKEPAQRPESAQDFVQEVERRARAAYGADWELVGRRRLAVLAAQSPERFPAAVAPPPANRAVHAPVPEGGTPEGDAPEEAGDGGWRRRRGLLAAAALLVVAGTLTVAAVAVGGGESEGPAQAREPARTDPSDSSATADPAEAEASPFVSAAPPDGVADAPGGAPTRSAAPTDRPDAGVAPDGKTRTTTPPAGTPSAPHLEGTPSAAPVAVSELTVSELRRSGRGQASAVIEVVATSTAPVEVTVVWYRGGDSDTLGDQDGEPETYHLSGQQRYQLTPQHGYAGLTCYWQVGVSTDPAGPDGEVRAGAAVPLCLG